MRAFDCCLFGGEIPSRTHDLMVAGVQAFDGVRGTNGFLHFHTVIQDENGFFPCIVQSFTIEGSFAPITGHLLEYDTG